MNSCNSLYFRLLCNTVSLFTFSVATKIDKECMKDSTKCRKNGYVLVYKKYVGKS